MWEWDGPDSRSRSRQLYRGTDSGGPLLGTDEVGTRILALSTCR